MGTFGLPELLSAAPFLCIGSLVLVIVVIVVLARRR